MLDQVLSTLAVCHDEPSYTKAVNKLLDQGLTLKTTLDTEGATLFHYLVENAFFGTLKNVLAVLNPGDIDMPTISGDTSLTLAIKNNNLLLSRLLVSYGASFIDEKMQRIFNRMHTSHSFRMIDEYIHIENILKTSIETCSFKHNISQLIDRGVKLDEPIDQIDSSLLHYLVRFAPVYVIEALLKYSDGKCNIHVADCMGRTPWLIAMRRNRHKVCAILENYEKNMLNESIILPWQFENVAQASFFDKEIASPEYVDEPLTYHFLMSSISQSARFQNFTTSSDKAKYIFKKFTSHIRNQKLQYSPIFREDGRYLLDCAVNIEHKVNCYDLSHAFGYILNEFNINTRVVEYVGVTEKDNTRTLKIDGSLVCFDTNYNSAIYASLGYYHFSKHCVIYCENEKLYFDPTFCCYYFNYGAILYSSNPLVDLRENNLAISVNVYPVGLRFPLDTILTFSEAFTTAFRKLFTKSEWKIKQSKETICAVKKQGRSEIKLLASYNSLMVTTKHASVETVASVIKKWERKTKPGLTFAYSVFMKSKAVQDELEYILKENCSSRSVVRL